MDSELWRNKNALCVRVSFSLSVVEVSFLNRYKPGFDHQVLCGQGPAFGFLFSIRFQPHRLCAHLQGFFQILRNLLFMAGLLVIGVESRHVESAVVFDLQHVKAAQHLLLAVVPPTEKCADNPLFTE